MIWLYRLQQRIAITKSEATTLFVLLVLFFGGVAARHFQQSPALLSPELLTAMDAEFHSLSAATLPDSVLTSSAPATGGATVLGTASETQRRSKAAAPIPRVNLNTATAAQLERLPRIGPKMAERILAYRAERGGFRHATELNNVKGIGQKTFEQLAPYVYVE